MTRNLVLAWTGVIVVLATAVRSWVAATGWFYWDDLVLTARAGDPGTSTTQMLLGAHDGHLMPGGMALILLARRTAALQWWMPVVQMTVLQLLAAAAVAWLLWVLLRGRPAVPLLVAPVLLSPLSLPSQTWWSAAVTAAPLTACLAVGCGAAVVAARTGRRAPALALAAATLVGLCFVEKAVLIPVVATAVALADRLLSRAAGRDATRREVGRGVARALAPGWAATAVVLLAWGVLYAVRVGSPRLPADPTQGPGVGLGELLGHTYSSVVLPALVGGPWRWGRWHPGPPFADPAGRVAVAGAVVALVACGWAGWRRRGVWPVLVVAALYPAVSVLAVAWARNGPGTSAVIVQTMRYHVEYPVVLAAAAALVLCAPRRTPVHGDGHGHGAGPGAPLSTAGRRVAATTLVAVVAAGALSVSSLVATRAYQVTWRDQPSREFVVPLLAALRARNSPVLDQQVPLEVLLPVVGPADRLSGLVGGLDGVPPIGDWAPEATLIDAHGDLNPAEPSWSRRPGPGPEPGCGHRVPAAGAAIPLDGPLMDREWFARLNYFAPVAGVARVAVDPARPTEVPLEAGLHSVVVRLAGAGDSLVVTPGAGQAELCIGDGPVGVLAPR